jgi:hypothetical protein
MNCCVVAAELPPARDIPDPIIFGQNFPELRLVHRSGKQIPESRSNENLRLRSYDFDERGTFTMAAFLSRAQRCRCGSVPADPRADPTPRCRLVLGERDELPVLHEGLDLAGCQTTSWLESLCQTDAQRRFLALWCLTQASRMAADWYEGLEGWLQWNGWAQRERLSFPALIPEVWLNYMGPNKTPDDEIHLEKNPSRVDFVMLAEGKKCVIEIDGPSHYADFNQETRRYTVSERKYSRNLKIERSLRASGWEIHRFSNLEVESATPETFHELVRLVPSTPNR